LRTASKSRVTKPNHARDFFVGFNVNPADLAVTTPALFFTRWVIHPIEGD
jgi:hypothetical protein